jgi:hypothetical protein
MAEATPVKGTPFVDDIELAYCVLAPKSLEDLAGFSVEETTRWILSIVPNAVPSDLSIHGGWLARLLRRDPAFFKENCRSVCGLTNEQSDALIHALIDLKLIEPTRPASYSIISILETLICCLLCCCYSCLWLR